MRIFSERLNNCRRRGGFTVSDLQRWFGRPRSTVNTWVEGREPFGPQAKRAMHRLDLLEYSLRVRPDYYPIGDDLSWTEREQFVRGMLDDAERHYSVPDVRATA
jgi:hypothetical protein